jgi:hypothetical protein
MKDTCNAIQIKDAACHDTGLANLGLSRYPELANSYGFNLYQLLLYSNNFLFFHIGDSTL